MNHAKKVGIGKKQAVVMLVLLVMGLFALSSNPSLGVQVADGGGIKTGVGG